MKTFMDNKFLLRTRTAEELFRENAGLPVIDYHCHLSPAEIAQDRRFKTITEAWLGGDHYKWRLMRINGVPERLITGGGDDYEKFAAFAATLERAIGNPVYHWAHLELQRFFGIYEPLTSKNAREIYDRCNKTLESPDMSACGMIKRSNVEVICTTDDPTDTLEYHAELRQKPISAKVLPAYRPDRAVDISRGDFAEYVEKLAQASGKKIARIGDLLDALETRMDYFASLGCTVSDMGFEYLPDSDYAEKPIDADGIFRAAMDGKSVTAAEADRYRAFMTHALGEAFARRGWVMQLHVGALRNINSGMFGKLGRDVGGDVVADPAMAKPLASLLDSLDKTGSLPKTILYSLNIKDYPVMAAQTGAFFEGGVPGKVQMGSAWWFADHIDGMTDQMKTLANAGLLSRFVGMLTDSRSFLSYPRHEYFRRIVADIFGTWVEEGMYPDDRELLNKMISGIYHDNAKEYFGF